MSPIPLFCYICNKRASVICSNCNRAACKEHIKLIDGLYTCTECIKSLGLREE